MSKLTPRMAIRSHCMNCMGVEPGHRLIDCASLTCPLRPCTPMRGKVDTSRLPAHESEDARELREKQMREADAAAPKREPSLRFVGLMCQECQALSTADCTSHSCALLPFTPYQPGGRPKVTGRTRPGSEVHLGISALDLG